MKLSTQPSKCRVAVVLTAVCLVVAFYGTQMHYHSRPSGIQHMVQKLRVIRDGQIEPKAMQLFELICRTPKSDISEQDIDSLISWAKQDDWGAYYASIALYQIGPRARRAAPVLEHALEQAKTAEAEVGPMTGPPASDTIDQALRMVKGEIHVTSDPKCNW